LTSVSVDRDELSVNHGDIPGFMPAMTMAYHVKDPALLTRLRPGDLVTATLVVPNGAIPYLINIRKTGHADIPRGTSEPHVMDVLVPGDEVPDDELVDQAGARRHLSDWRGSAIALTFIYTRCPMPDFCPLIDRKFAEVQQVLASDPALGRGAHLISVSFDPAYDTQQVLKAHATALHADPRLWTFATSPPGSSIAHFASRFGVSVMNDSGAETITHNLRTAVIDREGALVKIYSGNDWHAKTLVANLRDALGR
jgi:protein SCO1/2